MPRKFVLGALCGLVSLLAACEVPVVDAGAVTTLGAPAGTVIAGVARSFPRDAVPTSPSGEALTLASLEAPIAGAEITLLDAGLKPLANAPKITTDAGGRFELTGLPTGRTFVLELKLPDGRPLRTLIATVPGGDQVVISPATTIAAAMLLADLKEVPPAHDPRAFARLAHEIALYTTPAEFELIKEDRQLAAKVGAIAAGSKEVWDMLVELKKALSASPAPAAEVAKQIVPPTPRPSGAPTTAPTPTAAVTPTPVTGGAPFEEIPPADPFPFESPSFIQATPTPRPSRTPAPSPSPSPSPTPTPTPSPTPTATPTPSGSFVRTFAGTGQSGSQDGASPTFSRPMGLALKGGTLYVGDHENNRIRALTIGSGEAATTTETVAGGQAGNADGTGTAARFDGPQGLAWSPDGSKLLIADTRNERLRVMGPNGNVRTLGSPNGAPLPFLDPIDVAWADDTTAYVSEMGRHRIMKLAFAADGSATATVHAGDANGAAGFANAQGTAARFSKPRGLAINADGVLFVADSENYCIRRIEPNGTTSTIAGNRTLGDSNGNIAIEGQFNRPSDVAVGPDGALYVADTGNHMIRKISGNGALTLSKLTGSNVSSGGQGIDNGAVGSATFRSPVSLVIDGTRLYVADSLNHAVRLIVLRD